MDTVLTRARDTGQPALSARLTLVQETDPAVHRGVLLCAPVYRAGQPQETVEQRREALLGFVFSSFRMHDLMRGMLGRGDPEIGFGLFDGREIHLEALLFASEAEQTGVLADSLPTFTEMRAMEIAGQTWTLRLYTRPSFDTVTASHQPLVIAVGGLCLDCFLFYTLWQLATGRKRMIYLAEQMTAELRKSEERFRLLLETTPYALIMVDETDRICLLNAQAEALFGYARHELFGQAIERLLPAHLHSMSETYRGQFFAAPQGWTMEAGRNVYGQRKDGRTVPIEIGLNPLTIREDRFVLAAMIDISVRRQAQETLEAQHSLALLVADISGVVNVSTDVRSMLQRCTAVLVTHLNGPQGRVPIGQCKIGRIAAARQPYLTNAVLGDPQIGGQEWARREGLVAFAGCPLLLGDHLLGVLAIFSCHAMAHTTFTALEAVSDRIVLGLDRQQAEQALRDERALLQTMLAEKELLLKEIHHRVKNNMPVQLRSQDRDTVCLAVQDDGIGLPEALEWETAQTLGLRMVRTLARQIRATVAVCRGSGTEISVAFPRPPLSSVESKTL